MHTSRKILGLAAASLLIAAGSADAQGKSKDKDRDKDARKGEVVRSDRNREIVRIEDPRHPTTHDPRHDPRYPGRDARYPDRDRDGVYRDGVYRDGRRVPPGLAKKPGGLPPGLAKKPGGMPPGQYKKRYGSHDGAVVLRDVLGRRGYSVVRTADVGEAEHVYYRGRDGAVHRAIVSPGTDRLRFSNVPNSLLSEVLSRLY